MDLQITNLSTNYQRSNTKQTKICKAFVSHYTQTSSAEVC